MALIDQLTQERVPINGHLHPDFRAMADVLERLVRRYRGGAAVCVYYRGECVADLWGGTRNLDGDPWLEDTMSPSFSTTKGVASTLVHIMVDRGLLDYEARVAEYWPEFAQNGKEEITLRQVLSHQSGLYHIRQMVDDADRMLDWSYMVHAIEQSTPIHPPGERTGYHGLTYGFLVGEILHRVSGLSFPELVRRELAEPLELDGMFVGATEEAVGRAAKLIWPSRRRGPRSAASTDRMNVLADAGHTGAGWLRDGLRRVGVDFDLGSIMDALAPRGISAFDFGGDDTLRAAIPAANGLFTARSLAKMYALLAGGGELGGVRLLSEAAVERAAERQVRAAGNAVLPFDMRWRLGYHGVFTTLGSPRNAFGHFGFGGSGGWADPSRELAVALIVNCGMGTPFGDTRIARVGGAALCSERSARRRMPAPERSVAQPAESAA